MMTEHKTDEFEGKTVEEAVERGLRALGVRREEVEIEILSEGSRGILGIGSTPARVRLTRREPEEQVSPSEGEAEKVERGKESSAATQGVEQYASEALQGLLERMGFDATVNAYWGTAEEGERRPLVLNIEGKDLGLLIGRHSETLSALQYLVRVIINQRLHRWMNVVVDVENYRQRRKETLRRMAQRVAEQVAHTGRPVVLEAMPAADRRLIHIALRDHPDVYTISVGEEPRRKVTIRPKSELANKSRAHSRRRGGHHE